MRKGLDAIAFGRWLEFKRVHVMLCVVLVVTFGKGQQANQLISFPLEYSPLVVWVVELNVLLCFENIDSKIKHHNSGMMTKIVLEFQHSLCSITMLPVFKHSRNGTTNKTVPNMYSQALWNFHCAI